MNYLSVVIIAQNEEENIVRAIRSVKNVTDEIIVVDGGSSDRTVECAKEHGADVVIHPYTHEGDQRAIGLENASGEWILVLDADETVSSELAKEIKKIISDEKHTQYNGFVIPFQTYLFNRPLHHGGENYSQLRLFRKSKVHVSNDQIHSVYKVIGPVGNAHGVINHYSYRSIVQLFSKFTSYAKREAVRKRNAGEKVTLKKLTLYPIHMVYARYIKDQGYKDGPIRIILDLAWGYMEFMTYTFMLFN